MRKGEILWMEKHSSGGEKNLVNYEFFRYGKHDLKKELREESQ
jgi:hypothetical protein